jgi:hypothetical protein
MGPWRSQMATLSECFGAWRETSAEPDVDSAFIPIIIVPLAAGTQFFLASRCDWQYENCGRTFSPTARWVGNWRGAPAAGLFRGSRRCGGTR